jgi:hypothetical protein
MLQCQSSQKGLLGLLIVESLFNLHISCRCRVMERYPGNGKVMKVGHGVSRNRCCLDEDSCQLQHHVLTSAMQHASTLFWAKLMWASG